MMSLILILFLVTPTFGQFALHRELQRVPRVTCPTDGSSFPGSPAYSSPGPKAAPLRGNVGCVDPSGIALRPTATVAGQTQAAVNIYGPMEAGFSSSTPGMSCLGPNSVPGGVDTNLAEAMVSHTCNSNKIEVLDYCGGHAIPYHYHERMSCLYTSSPDGHSTRFGTALDGNGIYGPFIKGGVVPKDLDACGGRWGITPDSNGKTVYYYVVTSGAPFTLGCFGPVNSVQECMDLYPECDGQTVEVETDYGKGLYDLDCPCFDSDGSNVIGQGRPKFLGPIATEAPVTTPSQIPVTTSTPTRVLVTKAPTTKPSNRPSTQNPTKKPSQLTTQVPTKVLVTKTPSVLTKQPTQQDLVPTLQPSRMIRTPQPTKRTRTNQPSGKSDPLTSTLKPSTKRTIAPSPLLRSPRCGYSKKVGYFCHNGNGCCLVKGVHRCACQIYDEVNKTGELGASVTIPEQVDTTEYGTSNGDSNNNNNNSWENSEPVIFVKNNWEIISVSCGLCLFLLVLFLIIRKNRAKQKEEEKQRKKEYKEASELFKIINKGTIDYY